MFHLEAAGQLFKLRKAKGITSISEASSTPLHLYRVATESFLYHIATMALFHEDIDELSNKFSWADLHDGLNSNPFPDASKFANSPITGPLHNVYRLVFEVTELSRHVPLEGEDYQNALQYKLELETLKETLPQESEEDSTNPLALSLEQSDLLYVLPLQIYLFKVLHPEVPATHVYIQSLVRECMPLIQDCLVGDPSNFNLWWPILILSCAVQSPADVSLLKERLIEIWKCTLCGHIET